MHSVLFLYSVLYLCIVHYSVMRIELVVLVYNLAYISNEHPILIILLHILIHRVMPFYDIHKRVSCTGFFFPGGTGGPPIWRKFCQSPHPTLVPVFGPRLVPPPSRGSSPKFEKFEYIFVSNLTTFKPKSTLKSCISCLK